MTQETIIVIDDEEHLRITAAQTFDLADLNCVCFAQGEDALKTISRDDNAVVVTDIRMPGMDGVTVLRRALEVDPDMPVILVTGHGDIELAVECMRDGAYDFLEKPIKPDNLVACVRRALEKRRLTLQNRDLQQKINTGSASSNAVFGRSPVMQRLENNLRAIAATDVDVLITGDTGTGKEVVARALHAMSDRANGPFVHINCAALPEALVESELFGHEAGAFPGATRARFGKFEHARRGVLCLDEIDSLSLPLQAKLLHALQNKVITRLGSNDPIELDIRVIAISKSDLQIEIEAGRFRQDLFYLLNVMALPVPPLAERKEDIPQLFAALVAEAAARYDRPVPDVPGAIQQALTARDWPGNVRELRNMADRFALGLDLGLNSSNGTTNSSLASIMASHEKAILSLTIAANEGRLKPTYESLGLSRKSLYEKMQKHGLAKEDFAEKD